MLRRIVLDVFRRFRCALLPSSSGRVHEISYYKCIQFAQHKQDSRNKFCPLVLRDRLYSINMVRHRVGGHIIDSVYVSEVTKTAREA